MLNLDDDLPKLLMRHRQDHKTANPAALLPPGQVLSKDQRPLCLHTIPTVRNCADNKDWPGPAVEFQLPWSGV